MKRSADLVLLCEDRQQSAFMIRFFSTMGWNRRRIRVLPFANMSGEQHVRLNFPKELEAYRKRKNKVRCGLAVMIDGDNQGVVKRIRQLDDECKRHEVEIRNNDEAVAIFVPTWHIESWITYLDGQEVDENRRGYPSLNRARDCKKHVDELVKMCRHQQLDQPTPPSLVRSCEEFYRLKQ